MVNALRRHWWILALRGVAAILFGLAAYFWPGAALATLVLLFAAYAVVDGVLVLATGIRQAGENKHWWLLLLEGLVSILAGVAALFYPGITALVLLYFVAAWAVITGILEIVAAVRLREEIKGEFWLGLAGVLSILFGVALFLFPGPGALAVVWLIASYAVVFGIAMIGLGFRLRSASPPRVFPYAHVGSG